MLVDDEDFIDASILKPSLSLEIESEAGLKKHVHDVSHGFNGPIHVKVDGTVPSYTCKKGHITNDPLIKYKLDVEIYDGDDTAKFVLRDNPLDEFFGMNVATLLEKQKQVQYDLRHTNNVMDGDDNKETIFGINQENLYRDDTDVRRGEIIHVEQEQRRLTTKK
ncbi:hypothetical protein P8452_44470 [Trifolium repens]|nr:hypothetical protein P8452_44470 [Trifolium repens]